MVRKFLCSPLMHHVESTCALTIYMESLRLQVNPSLSLDPLQLIYPYYNNSCRNFSMTCEPNLHLWKTSRVSDRALTCADGKSESLARDAPYHLFNLLLFARVSSRGVLSPFGWSLISSSAYCLLRTMPDQNSGCDVPRECSHPSFLGGSL